MTLNYSGLDPQTKTEQLLDMIVESVESIAGGGGNTQYTTSDAYAIGNTGTMSLAVRNDSLASLLTSTDGNFSPIAVNGYGQIYVQDISALGYLGNMDANITGLIGGTYFGDDSTIIPHTRGYIQLGIRNDNLATTMAGTNAYGAIQSMTSLGELATVPLGRDVDNAAITINRPMYIAGKAVDADSYAPAYTAADIAALALDKDTGGLLVDSRDRASSSNEYSPTTYASTAYENQEVVKNSAGNLFGITGYNSGPGQWIQVHNTTSVPSDTAVPIVIFFAAAASNFFWDAGKYGYYFSTGITIVNSTTGPTKTIGLADCWFNVTFK